MLAIFFGGDLFDLKLEPDLAGFVLDPCGDHPAALDVARRRLDLDDLFDQLDGGVLSFFEIFEDLGCVHWGSNFTSLIEFCVANTRASAPVSKVRTTSNVRKCFTPAISTSIVGRADGPLGQVCNNTRVSFSFAIFSGVRSL